MNDIELIKYQTLLWIDIWKKKLSKKIESKYYSYFLNTRCECGFCHLFFDRNFFGKCISKSCPLKKWEKLSVDTICVVSFSKWCDELNFHAAAHIAWVSRKYYRQIGSKEL